MSVARMKFFRREGARKSIIVARMRDFWSVFSGGSFSGWRSLFSEASWFGPILLSPRLSGHLDLPRPERCHLLSRQKLLRAPPRRSRLHPCLLFCQRLLYDGIGTAQQGRNAFLPANDSLTQSGLCQILSIGGGDTWSAGESGGQWLCVTEMGVSMYRAVVGANGRARNLLYPSQNVKDISYKRKNVLRRKRAQKREIMKRIIIWSVYNNV